MSRVSKNTKYNIHSPKMGVNVKSMYRFYETHYGEFDPKEKRFCKRKDGGTYLTSNGRVYSLDSKRGNGIRLLT